VIWRRILALVQPEPPTAPAIPPSAAGRRLAQAAIDKRRAARKKWVAAHVAAIAASIPKVQEPTT
jgi:hypothetical protein